ncbi:MAG TPA: DUF2336 domain-containing protein [Vicinamibacterales bacterium]|nr:DUF2336 domain-containing protein [Vicinamibacterales bacterium]
MLDAHPLFAELEATLTNGPGSQRFTILRKITDLFLSGADTYSDDHVAVFDELMSRLTERIERQALIELSGRLAAVERAPLGVVGQLSQNDDIDIAGPILERSEVLTDEDLVIIAKTKSQAHLSAIAGRIRINEPVTDVLIDRGDAEVARKVTTNSGARFSRFGLNKAVARAEHDDSLALAVASRLDLPADLLEQLVRKATATVQQRLLANARPEMRQRITDVLTAVSNEVARAVAPPEKATAARTMMRQDPARLRARIVQCAESRNSTELIDTLAVLAEIPVKAIKDLIGQTADEGLIVLGRACGIGWPDLQKVLVVAGPSRSKTPEELSALFASYSSISVANAQRAVRFIRTSRSKFADEIRKLI